MYILDFEHPVHVHFIGIGGISMSGLAQVLLSRNFKVSGSDNQRSPLTDELERRGATIYIGQRAGNLSKDIDVCVYTAAIHPDNPEYAACVEMNITMLSRAQLLGQIMKNYASPIAISGTHGKTTTTSMLSEILLGADTDPTLSIGGILKSINGNFRIGHSDYFLTEACEYTNSFLSFYPKYSIILNIEEDHLDFFKDLSEIRDSFHRFAKLLPKDGALLINGEIENFCEITDDLDCRVYSFGMEESNDYYPTDITYNEKGCASYILHTPSGESIPVSLSVVGAHNVSNSVAALGMADIIGLPLMKAGADITGCGGADRRFELKGIVGGVTVIDDYAHHPTEIKATLEAASKYPHQHLWCVFQPHTYSRTKAFMDDFADALSNAEHVILADIYAARETDTLGISSRQLQEKISEKGTDCHYFRSFGEIEKFLLENCIPGDLLITMGAGDVVKVGENLLGQ